MAASRCGIGRAAVRRRLHVASSPPPPWIQLVAWRTVQDTCANSLDETRSLPQVVRVRAHYTAFHLDGESQRDQGQQADCSY